MKNVFESKEFVDFWVWINPDNWLVRHQIQFTGGFSSGGNVKGGKSNLMFTPNPDFNGELTAFHFGIMREYIAEYNLEMGRKTYAPNYPSRLNSIYLFDSEDEANKYKEIHLHHVRNRILKKVHSVGPCVYSRHDLSWVDFLRLTHTVLPESVANVSKAYWGGDNVENYQLSSLDQPWTQSPIIETLFLGRIDFYDKNLERNC